MVKFFILIISLITFCDLALSTNIVCDYDFETYSVFDSVYTCKAKNNPNITSRDATLIETAIGNHKIGRSNNDVIVFEVENKKVEYFPKGLDKIFPNLKGIYIKNGKLKEIQQSDFKGYQELIFLELSNNNIEVLEDGVFDFLLNIKIILLTENKITHVGEKVFDELLKLQYLGLVQNTCIDVSADEFETNSIRILTNLKEKCFDENFAKLSTKIANLENDAKTVTRENFHIFSRNLEKLEKEFKSSKFSYLSSIKERFYILKFVTSESVASQNSCFASKFKNLEESLIAVVVKTVDNNLKKFQTSTCTKIDERIEDYNTNLDNSFSDLINKLRETDKNLKEFIKFPTEISKRIGKFECDQKQFTKNEIHGIKQINVAENTKFKKLEERIGKIEENIEKILQNLNSRN